LRKLSDEDPTFRIRGDEETAETIISGMGELHLEIIVDRMKGGIWRRSKCRPSQVHIRKPISEKL